MHHRTPLMVVALCLVFAACGDEDDDYKKKNNEESSGRPRSSSGGKQDAGPGSMDDDAGTEEDPDDLDAGEPDERDGSSGARDGSSGTSDGGTPAADAGNAGDARADAQPTGSDGGMCAEPGDDCESLDCCAGATCIIEPETGAPICAAECLGPSECNSACCIEVRDSDFGACVPARYCEAPPVPMGSGCDTLSLLADDGTFLGNASSSAVAANGVCNTVSPHGNSVGANSIFNTVGTYGSSVRSQSAYNSLTSTPPMLVCDDSGEIVAYVTKNPILSGASLVDPDTLCGVLANSGF